MAQQPQALSRGNPHISGHGYLEHPCWHDDKLARLGGELAEKRVKLRRIDGIAQRL